MCSEAWKVLISTWIETPEEILNLKQRHHKDVDILYKQRSKQVSRKTTSSTAKRGRPKGKYRGSAMKSTIEYEEMPGQVKEGYSTSLQLEAETSAKQEQASQRCV